MLELRQFRYFVAVAEELHFSRAALRLNIGQPPLTLQIQSIERELGVLLFKRDRRKVELTEAGRLFLKEARRTLSQAGRAVDTAKRAALGEIGQLRLSFVTSALLVDAFPRAVKQFREVHPNIGLRLKVQPTQEILDHLMLDTLDLGVIRPSSRAGFSADIRNILIQSDRLRVVLSQDHPLAEGLGPVALEDLADEPFVLRPSGTGIGFYEQVHDLCVHAGFLPNIVQEAQEATTTLGLVAAGLGITIAPASQQAIQIEGIVWRDLTNSGEATSSLFLAYNQRVKNMLRDRFVEHVKRVAASSKSSL